MRRLPAPVMVSWRGYTTPLARPHGVGCTPPRSWRLGAGPLPGSARWLARSFRHRAVLAYRRRPPPPGPVTRPSAPHAERSGGGRRWHEHDPLAIVGRRPLHGPDTVITAVPEGPRAHVHAAGWVAGPRRSD